MPEPGERRGRLAAATPPARRCRSAAARPGAATRGPGSPRSTRTRAARAGPMLELLGDVGDDPLVRGRRGGQHRHVRAAARRAPSRRRR